MSYRLTKLIRSLTKEEVRNFKIYTSRFAHKGDEKKLVTLFDAIRKHDRDEYDEKLVNRLFPDSAKNSFYRLKNRLVGEIEESLTQFHKDKDHEFELYRLLQLSKIYAFKSDFEEAKRYLEKAEKLATNSDNYSLLNIVYEKILTLVHRTDFPTEDYIEKYKENAQLAGLSMQNTIFQADIVKRLRLSNFSGKESEVVEQFNDHISRLQSENESLNSPEVQLQISAMIRSVFLQQKDFQGLLKYSIDSYEEFKAEGIFGKSNHEKKIVALVWIINAATKAQKPNLIHYVEELHEALLEYNKLFYDKYIWTYYQSKVIIHTFSREIDAAIELLERVKEENLMKDNTNHLIFTYINLSTLYYFKDNFGEAFSNLAAVILSPDFKELSMEWKLRITLLEIMLRSDNGDIEYAIGRCKEAKRKYKSLLSEEAYQRENQLLKFTSQLLRKPDKINNKVFKEDLERFIAQSTEFEPGSNEAINYSFWLKAKIENRTYYDLIPNIFDVSV